MKRLNLLVPVLAAVVIIVFMRVPKVRAWAAERGVTAGIGNGLFGVNDTCTRAQIITFLAKVYAPAG